MPTTQNVNILSTGSKVESDDITSRNILLYVPIIIQNKVFLMDDPDADGYVYCYKVLTKFDFSKVYMHNLK